MKNDFIVKYVVRKIYFRHGEFSTLVIISKEDQGHVF